MPSQVLYAPSSSLVTGSRTIFLAGSTAAIGDTDWRQVLSASLSQYPITIFNPHRPDWDSTWVQDISFTPFREQVTWELEKQEKADLVVIYFQPSTTTEAPISLLELGISVRSAEKVICVAPVGYKRRGNVQVVCLRYGIEFLDSIDGLRGRIVHRLGLEAL
ncbi:hypothetical protein F4808DRAFT_263145 [Astrocystis sublimbata]|nr:hypothetical protein F4808DRAFT_263145 [Astrocystis sublimbata]